MKPCGCKDQKDLKKLNEQELRFNENSIKVKPPNVILKISGHSLIAISQNEFKKFVEWYLEDQPEYDGWDADMLDCIYS